MHPLILIGLGSIVAGLLLSDEKKSTVKSVSKTGAKDDKTVQPDNNSLDNSGGSTDGDSGGGTGTPGTDQETV